eukprot:COSAG01_NODE_23163_length_826_cov_0.482806_2_plen_67_part_00
MIDEPEEEVLNIYTFEGVDYHFDDMPKVLYNIKDRAVIGLRRSNGKIRFIDNGEKIHKKNKKKCTK